MIKKRDWETAYGVYAFNICKSTDYESDNMMKTFQIKFTLESTAKFNRMCLLILQIHVIMKKENP